MVITQISMRVREQITALALFTCLIAAWVYSEKKRATIVRLPPGVTKLIPFLETRAQPHGIYKFTYKDKLHFKVVGDSASVLLSLPSGPPVYVLTRMERYWIGQATRAITLCSSISGSASMIRRELASVRRNDS